METSKIVSGIIHCLLHELLAPLIAVHASCDILKDKAPTAILEQVGAIDETCVRCASEIHDLREHLAERVNLESPEEAAAQLRQLVSGWREYEVGMSGIAQKIDEIKNAGLDMKESEAFLNTLTSGLKRLDRWLNYWEVLGQDDLIRWDDERLAQIVDPMT